MSTDPCEELRAAAEAVVSNWRGPNRGWVNVHQVAGNLEALRAALAGQVDQQGEVDHSEGEEDQ